MRQMTRTDEKEEGAQRGEFQAMEREANQDGQQQPFEVSVRSRRAARWILFHANYAYPVFKTLKDQSLQLRDSFTMRPSAISMVRAPRVLR